MAFWSVLSSPSSRIPSPARPSPLLFYLLIGSYLLTLVPHVEQLPVWVTISVIAVATVRIVQEIYRLPMPSDGFIAILAISCLIGILLQFHYVLGRDSGTAFTVSLLAIKFFEWRGPRDVAMIIFSSFFVLISALLYSQVVELFVYCLIMFWVLTALLMRVQIGDGAEDHLMQMLGRSGLIFLQALPLALFLFFFFPRYSGKLQITLNENPVGITDELMPGSISKLSDDDSMAMYVRFKGDAPSVDSMYWRALVLSQYKNGKWIQDNSLDTEVLPDHGLPAGAPHTDSIDQIITVEPHFKKWIFALDSPVTTPTQLSDTSFDFVMIHGSVLRLNGARNLDHKLRYSVTSYAQLAPMEDLSKRERRIETAYPDDIDPRVLELSRQFAGTNPGDEKAYISNVFRYFWDQKFTYSVEPGQEAPGHEKEWLANFLLKRKTGFCEHYASAFAILMRLNHIPARVVIGYQGGNFNTYANSYEIVQSDAHSWDEVWLTSEHRWVRYDPTAILNAGESPNADSSQRGNNQTNGVFALQNTHHSFLSVENLPMWMQETYKDLQMRRDQMEANWDDVVLSYDPDVQGRLSHAMGLGQNPAALIIFCLLATIFCGFTFFRVMKRKPPVSPVEDLYAQFCRSMAQRGMLRADWEGPLAYTRRVADAFPEKSAAIQDLGLIVARCRYGRPPTDPASPRQLKSLLIVITASQAASSSRES
jgi:transglutaminase-like putative cysteine protease